MSPAVSDLRHAALDVFAAGLMRCDAGEAVLDAVRLEGDQLRVNDTRIDLTSNGRRIYAVAVGKVARPMAAALDESLGESLTAGVAVGVAPPDRDHGGRLPLTVRAKASSSIPLTARWQTFAGGHPLPNEASLAAGRAAIALLRRAEAERALVLLLVSGGGSAMIEWPRDERTTLAELCDLNRGLVSCGAPVAEINAVRRAVSAVKGGGLAAHAPHADQISLVITDTNAGEEWAVASGPSIEAPPDAPDAREVVARYGLSPHLPPSIRRALEQAGEGRGSHPPTNALRRHYTLLDNAAALDAAAEAARGRGFVVEVARDVVEDEIAAGCEELLKRLSALRVRAGGAATTCLISGGEFKCPVRGRGLGGRNSETALRCAIRLAAAAWGTGASAAGRTIILSGGTDGIDGNSPAAGALADPTTLTRARARGLDARRFLDESDAYTFFHLLNDAVMTGPTGTNVRDLRVMLAAP